ncbi:hypothetical protein VY88_06130 [Azospirillum thiophilum]|uniref:DUF2783 domain-containing protein n=1 Tax=Azospirillum thiophilum TaxID=528244 RepID=A0AAC8ZTY1_9PROT|nr:DUF2783 domain-containing protein [Azospirillum thiophilum]ALG70630.1 hypothetical protein AL072_06580 [Azospirillum thiophilum]KJR65700.1 hypothetical protein VY88_06130 [Azospirillum thiophilum]
MADLITDQRFASPDDVYQMLIDSHRDLTADQSARLNAKLILLLANHIGDPEILAEALRIARQGVA